VVHEKKQGLPSLLSTSHFCSLLKKIKEKKKIFYYCHCLGEKMEFAYSIDVDQTQLPYLCSPEYLNSRNKPNGILQEIPPTIQAHVHHLQKIEGIQVSQIASGQIHLIKIWFAFDGNQKIIGKVAAPTRPNFKMLMIAGMHAREWLAMEIVLTIARTLAEKPFLPQTTSSSIVELHIIPCVNMIGYSSTASVFYPTKFKTMKNGQLLTSSAAAEVRNTRKQWMLEGIDLNRCFDSHWEKNQEKDDPEHATYPGSKVLEHPFCKALADLTLSENYDFVLDVHDYGNMIVKYPCFDPGANQLTSIELQNFESAAKTLKPVHELLISLLFPGRSYEDAVQRPYDAFGLYTDWCTSKHGIPAAVVEIGDKTSRFTADTNDNLKMERVCAHKLLQFVVLMASQHKNLSETLKQYVC